MLIHVGYLSSYLIYTYSSFAQNEVRTCALRSRPQHHLGTARDAIDSVWESEASRDWHGDDMPLSVIASFFHRYDNLLCRGTANTNL